MAHDNPFFAETRQRFESLGQSLVSSGAGRDVRVTESDDGVDFTITRAADGVAARITMTGTTEAFLLYLGDEYSEVTTAYEIEDQRAAVDDYVSCVAAFIRRDYYEEVGERHGQIVRRVLYLTVPDGPRIITGKTTGWNLVGWVLGYQTKIVRPDASD